MVASPVFGPGAVSGAIATCLDAHILSITFRADHLALDCVVQRAPSFSQLRRERWSKLLLQTPHQRFTKRDEVAPNWACWRAEWLMTD